MWQNREVLPEVPPFVSLRCCSVASLLAMGVMDMAQLGDLPQTDLRRASREAAVRHPASTAEQQAVSRSPQTSAVNRSLHVAPVRHQPGPGPLPQQDRALPASLQRAC